MSASTFVVKDLLLRGKDGRFLLRGYHSSSSGGLNNFIDSLGHNLQRSIFLKLTNKTSYPIAQLVQGEKNRGREKGEN